MLSSDALRSITPFDEFISTRREPTTRLNYKFTIKIVFGDPNKFLELAKNNKLEAERLLINYLVENRDKKANTTLAVRMSNVKTFIEYADILLNWKKIRSVLGPARMVALDRAPSIEEIRKLLDVCDIRMRATVLLLASSGIREGALTELKIGDIQFLDSGLGRLRIYVGTPDEYYTFITEEAVKAIQVYYDQRSQVGEDITSESPFLRDKWSYGKKHTRLDPTNGKHIKTGALFKLIDELWVKAGIRSRDDKRQRKEFKAVHGFRKFFKTQAGQVIRNKDDAEVLMGHILNYYKPTLPYLEQIYLEAQACFVISEVQEVQKKSEQIKKVHNEEIKDVRLLLFDKDQQLQRLRGVVEDLSGKFDKLSADWNTRAKPELERYRKKETAKQN